MRKNLKPLTEGKGDLRKRGGLLFSRTGGRVVSVATELVAKTFVNVVPIMTSVTCIASGSFFKNYPML